MFTWLYKYFNNRRLKVNIESSYSEEVQMEAGTPQGAGLSPMLFNLILAELPDGYGITKLIYADDITLVCCGIDVRGVCKNMQCYLTKLENLMKMWGMILNLKKHIILCETISSMSSFKNK